MILFLVKNVLFGKYWFSYWYFNYRIIEDYKKKGFNEFNTSKIRLIVPKINPNVNFII